MRERCRLERWHWIRDTLLHEDIHPYRGNGGPGVVASLHTAALSLLSPCWFQSIWKGLQTLMHDIAAPVAMALRQPREKPIRNFESALGAHQPHPQETPPTISASCRCPHCRGSNRKCPIAITPRSLLAISEIARGSSPR